MSPFCTTSWDFFSKLFQGKLGLIEIPYKFICGILLLPTIWGIPLIILVIGLLLIGFLLVSILGGKRSKRQKKIGQKKRR